MLSERFNPDHLTIVSQADYTPYPRATDRAAWDSLPADLRAALIAWGETALQTPWEPLLAARFLEYARVGNRSEYERENFGRRNKLVALALAECAEGEGRFVDEIANGVWLICEETYWGLPAHVGVQKAGVGLPDVEEPTVDLFAAETAAALAYVDYLLGGALDSVSPLIRRRVAYEIQHQILTPLRERDDFRWMGFDPREGRPNNWNPWINSNWLLCVLLVEPDDSRRRAAIAKIMRSLDQFIDPYPVDGGCDEGPGYWMRAAASLFECLDLLHAATGGQIDVWSDPLIGEMGRFIYRAHIDGDYYLNFADATAVLKPEAELIYRYGKAIGDRDMMAFGAWAPRRSGGNNAGGWGRPIESPMRWLPLIFTSAEIASAEAYAPKPHDVWLPETQVMVARDDHWYVAAKGGHNDESHNHNDVGEFVVYRDGLPLLIDAGVETYSRKTFSPQRYEIWTMQSQYHNLPLVDGIQQSPGAQYAARDVVYNAADASLTLDIAGAYPPEAGLVRWTRTVRLNRDAGIVEVVDDYALDHAPQTMSLSLLTPCTVMHDGEGVLRLLSAPLPDGRVTGGGIIRFDGRMKHALDFISITDARMKPAWGGQLTRIVLSVRSPQQNDTWTLRIEG